MIEWLNQASELGFALAEFILIWVGLPVFILILIRAFKYSAEKVNKDGPS